VAKTSAGVVLIHHRQRPQRGEGKGEEPNVWKNLVAKSERKDQQNLRTNEKNPFGGHGGGKNAWRGRQPEGRSCQTQQVPERGQGKRVVKKYTLLCLNRCLNLGGGKGPKVIHRILLADEKKEARREDETLGTKALAKDRVSRPSKEGTVSRRLPIR